MLKKIWDVLWRRIMALGSPRDIIRKIGHRRYIGGKWDEIGKLQFDFMTGRGLKPEHVLLDIACGPLRGGVHFIRYLNRGNYLGIEKEEDLIRAGIDKELGRKLFEEKSPELVTSGTFEFNGFSKHPQFAIAHAIFTHLTPADIELCLNHLRAVVEKDCRFYATFFESPSEMNHAALSRDYEIFKYTRMQMNAFGEKCGWRPVYIGEWNHPRGQMMMEYTAI